MLKVEPPRDTPRGSICSSQWPGQAPLREALAQKRGPSEEPLALQPPVKKQTKWQKAENEQIIQLRAAGMKWEDISKNLPGRSAISCRLHYQNFLERKPEWNEEKMNKLARLYER